MPKKTAKQKTARPPRKAAKKKTAKKARKTTPTPAADRPAWALRMEAARAVLGLTVREAASQAGIRAATWSDLETGTADPSLRTLQAVAAALGLTLERLFREPRA